MALPSTGAISMSQVNTELKKSSTATISLNDTDVRKLAGRTSGTISVSDLRGKHLSTFFDFASLGRISGSNVTKELPIGRTINQNTKIVGTFQGEYRGDLGNKVDINNKGTNLDVWTNIIGELKGRLYISNNKLMLFSNSNAYGNTYIGKLEIYDE